MKKRTKIAFLLLFAAVMIGGISLLHHQVSETEKRRKRDSDAFSVRNALFAYMRESNGAQPPSLSSLKYDREDVDASPFRLLPPGSRIGRIEQDVLVQARQAGNGDFTIYIYADGTVDWE